MKDYKIQSPEQKELSPLSENQIDLIDKRLPKVSRAGPKTTQTSLTDLPRDALLYLCGYLTLKQMADLRVNRQLFQLLTSSLRDTWKGATQVTGIYGYQTDHGSAAHIMVTYGDGAIIDYSGYADQTYNTVFSGREGEKLSQLPSNFSFIKQGEIQKVSLVGTPLSDEGELIKDVYKEKEQILFKRTSDDKIFPLLIEKNIDTTKKKGENNFWINDTATKLLVIQDSSSKSLNAKENYTHVEKQKIVVVTEAGNVYSCLDLRTKDFSVVIGHQFLFFPVKEKQRRNYYSDKFALKRFKKIRSTAKFQVQCQQTDAVFAKATHAQKKLEPSSPEAVSTIVPSDLGDFELVDYSQELSAKKN